MNITIKSAKYPLAPETEALIEEKLAAPMRLFGEKGDAALLEIEVEQAPAEGRSSEPCKLTAKLSIEGKVFYAEAVKPTPEIAADRVRDDFEAEIRKVRGRSQTLYKRGGAAIKKMLRWES